MTRQFLPGSTIGVMGGGQLGRMFAGAARRMGYRVHVFSPEQNGPAAQLSDFSTVADYSDKTAVEQFASAIDVLTFEFENIPVQTVNWCSDTVPVRPAAHVLHTAQHRLREKTFLSRAGFPVAPFRAVANEAELAAAIAAIGTPCILKTAGFGYDGKGQQFIGEGESAADLWRDRPGDELILEKAIEFEREISVIVARGPDGATAAFPVSENIHDRHILDITIVPARVDPETAMRATQLACDVARGLDVIGLLAVEMFETGGDILINELAPRPHNSGHWTIEGAVTSQFEQHVRSVCGLPLGATDVLQPTAMANLLGDLWAQGEPHWGAAMLSPHVHLHLYGKSDPRPRRKMGHLTAVGVTSEAAAEEVRAARAALTA